MNFLLHFERNSIKSVECLHLSNAGAYIRITDNASLKRILIPRELIYGNAMARTINDHVIKNSKNYLFVKNSTKQSFSMNIKVM
jgi:hypothetical protein